MKLPRVYHPDYSIRWSPVHRFPMSKFHALYQGLLAEGLAAADDFHVPEPVSRETLFRVHQKDYVERFFSGDLEPRAVREIGLTWSQALVRRTRLEVGGTVLAAKLALAHGLACQTAGGTHHAFPAKGSGFCVLNDLAVAARWALDRGLAKRILILDLDVHQGDGTAFIFREEPAVFTCSIHCERNFPVRKQRSDLDIGLPRGVRDDTYLGTLEKTLTDLAGRIQPDLVFYDAGVDVHESDRLGHLSLSDEGLFARDLMVLTYFARKGWPVAGVIGGGYAHDIAELTNRHAQLHRAAGLVWQSHFVKASA